MKFLFCTISGFIMLSCTDNNHVELGENTPFNAVPSNDRSITDIAEVKTLPADYRVSQAFREKYPDSFFITREVDREFYVQVKRGSWGDDGDYVIASRGGNVRYGLRAARIIKNSGFTVRIFELCESACAEYILPAAKKLIFIDDPLIGFHLNPVSDVEFVKQKTGNAERSCSYGLAAQTRELYKQVGANPDFWKMQYKRLGSGDVKIISHDECDEVSVTNLYPMWYPTSKQLKEEFGLKFEGSVCADSYKCYSKKIPQSASPGEIIAVGNKRFKVNKKR